MWQAFESSIQTLNRARRMNMSLKKSSKNQAASQTISRPTASINELVRRTKFSKDEIRHLYRTFKQGCPSGEINKTQFVAVFATIFPQGESHNYSTFLYQNIDRVNTGLIRFEDLVSTLSILLHGSIEEQLTWIFDFYDLNKDGILTRAELFQIVASIFQLIAPGCKMNSISLNHVVEEHTDYLFETWDIHRNGQVSKDDFLQYCLQDQLIRHSLDLYKSSIWL